MRLEKNRKRLEKEIRKGEGWGVSLRLWGPGCNEVRGGAGVGHCWPWVRGHGC